MQLPCQKAVFYGARIACVSSHAINRPKRCSYGHHTARMQGEPGVCLFAFSRIESMGPGRQNCLNRQHRYSASHHHVRIFDKTLPRK